MDARRTHARRSVIGPRETDAPGFPSAPRERRPQPRSSWRPCRRRCRAGFPRCSRGRSAEHRGDGCRDAANQRPESDASGRSAGQPPRLHPRDRGPDRDEEGLRSRAVRRLHGARERPARELVPHAGPDARRRRDHDDRGAGHARRPASHAGRVRGDGRVPVRLLHVRADHVGRRAAQGAVRSGRRGREGADERQHLPVRRVRRTSWPRSSRCARTPRREGSEPCTPSNSFGLRIANAAIGDGLEGEDARSRARTSGSSPAGRRSSI